MYAFFFKTTLLKPIKRAGSRSTQFNSFTKPRLGHLFCRRVKIKLVLEQAMKAQRGSRGVVLLFFVISALDVGRWLVPRPGHFTLGIDMVAIA
jgi:hypothetical protein